MTLVVDASCAAAWCLPDESSPVADAAFAGMRTDTAFVPTLFWYEIRNLFIKAERQGRVDEPRTTRLLERLAQLAMKEDRSASSDDVLALARTHRLTVYDAAYLELARRRALPLATLDRQLADAARAAGVPLLTG